MFYINYTLIHWTH